MELEGRLPAKGARGRPKGSPNKATINLQERIKFILSRRYPIYIKRCFRDDGFDPVIAIAMLGAEAMERVTAIVEQAKKNDEPIPLDVVTQQEIFALRCFQEVSEYWHAKKKAVEKSDDADSSEARLETAAAILKLLDGVAARHAGAHQGPPRMVEHSAAEPTSTKR